MDPFTTNGLVQTAAGIVGSHAASIAAKEHSFGIIGHTVVGLIGGALSGYFLQNMFAAVTDGTGGSHPASGVDNMAIQVMSGLVVGAICMFLIGMIRHFIEQHNTSG